MGKRRRVRTQTRVVPSEGEKARIIAACDKFIAETLKPRFLPEIRSTEFNYRVAIYGKWRDGRYRFIERHRSDSSESIKLEFEKPFTRLDYIGPDRFDVMWRRHPGQWWPPYRLEEALRCIEQDERLHPL